MKEKTTLKSKILFVVLLILSLAWIYPVFMILINSFKTDRNITTRTVFQLPNADSFAGLSNFVDALTSKGFAKAFGYSLMITITSVVLILICCSMCAWFITRVNGIISKILYFLFVFSMVVPFQMLMFTIPLEIEEAAMIDGCNPLQTFFLIVLPILKPTLISVGILETMWLWNDYLLPYLVLDRKKYMTIPILIQYFQGSYGKVEMGPMMACILMTVLPIIIVYLVCQKYIIKGVMAGAVKG